MCLDTTRRHSYEPEGSTPVSRRVQTWCGLHTNCLKAVWGARAHATSPVARVVISCGKYKLQAWAKKKELTCKTLEWLALHQKEVQVAVRSVHATVIPRSGMLKQGHKASHSRQASTVSRGIISNVGCRSLSEKKSKPKHHKRWQSVSRVKRSKQV